MVLHVTLVFPHLRETVIGGRVGHCAVREWPHRMHPSSDGIKGEACNYSGTNGSTRGPQSVDPARTKEEVGVFLAPVINVRHSAAKSTDAEAVCDGSSHKNAFVGGPHETIQDATIVAPALLGVQLIDLHARKDQIDWVSHDTGEEASTEASHDVPIRASGPSWIGVQLVIEEEEAPDAGRRIGACLGEEAVPARVKLSIATARTVNLFEDAARMEAPLESDTCEELALLEHL